MKNKTKEKEIKNWKRLRTVHVVDKKIA